MPHFLLNAPLPIVSRELRVEARAASNYVLRLLGAGGIGFTLYFLMSGQTVISASLGIELFTGIHALILSGIWIAAPILTADSLSRERREGTLPLLFSTEMTARGIVLGKSCVHMVRAVTLWLSALPMLIVPFLVGGVTGLDVFSALTLQACSLLLALCAGLLASSLTSRFSIALLLSELLAAATAIVFLFAVGFAVVTHLSPLMHGMDVRFTTTGLRRFGIEFALGATPNGGWSRLSSIAAQTTQQVWAWLLIELMLASSLAFFLALALASKKTSETWQDQPLSARQLRRRRFWLEPRFWLAKLRLKQARQLDRNPIGWLNSRSAKMRASILGSCALVLFVDSLVMINARPYYYFNVSQLWLSILLSLHLTIYAAKGLRTERNSGVLELLLVTPMPTSTVIARLVFGFWRRFFWPVVLFLALSRLCLMLDLASPNSFGCTAFLVLNFIVAPIIGFYASARFRSFTAAWVLTALLTLGFPLFGPELAPGFLDRINSAHAPWFTSFPWATPPDGSRYLINLSQIALIAAGLWSWDQLTRILETRCFLWEKSQE